MPRTRAAFAASVLIAMGSPAVADHVQPARARVFKGTLVTAYAPCTTPNTATTPTEVNGLTWPACTPAVRENPTCGFGPDGSGQVEFRTSGDKIGVKVKVRGLDAGCEGTLIAVNFLFDVTGDLCDGATCTLPFESSWGACTVTEGRCSMGDNSRFFFLSPGGRSGMVPRAVDVYSNGVRAFQLGVLFE
jgi:hypothetical protein